MPSPRTAGHAADEESAPVILSLDGMGGDNAPHSVVEGAAAVRRRNPAVQFLLYGDQSILRPLVDARPALRGGVDIRHTDVVVGDSEKPSAAVRAGRRSSMGMAVEAVRAGEADGVVSGGNTGALMAMGLTRLRTVPGIHRPAITGIVPTLRRPVCMLDLGANLDADADNLVQFALLGDAFARCVLGCGAPTVGLLNVGVEETKGRDAVREAAAILQGPDAPVTFHGFVEGGDIMRGVVDVVITDGYTGNITLKTMEGMARFLRALVAESFGTNLLTRLSALFALPALRVMRRRTDPRRHNGAVLLGLNGIVVKSHGGSDALAFAHAIETAVHMARNRLLPKIHDSLARIHPVPDA